MLRLVALLALFAPATAFADNEADALALLGRGVDLFQAGDLVGARELFERAHKAVPERSNPMRWLGLTDARLGRCGEAIEELDAFLNKVPADDARAPEARTARAICKTELDARVGTLEVDSTPPGAEVRIDGPRAAAVGVTPYHGERVAVGEHSVFVGPAGNPTVNRVTVNARETVRLQVTLAEPPTQPAPPAARPASLPLADTTPAHTERPRRSRAWIIGATVGGVVLVGLAVGLGVGLSSGSDVRTPTLGMVSVH
jgi:hypothetical protein